MGQDNERQCRVKLEAVKLYKKSHKGNYFTKTVTGKDYKSDSGYNCRVVSSGERQKQGIETISKFNAAKQEFPTNPVFKKIYDKKLLEFLDVNPEEIQAILDFEEQNIQQGLLPPGQPGQPGAPQLTPQPNAVPQLAT